MVWKNAKHLLATCALANVVLASRQRAFQMVYKVKNAWLLKSQCNSRDSGIKKILIDQNFPSRLEECYVYCKKVRRHMFNWAAVNKLIV